MKCRQCGSELREGARFCHECGAAAPDGGKREPTTITTVVCPGCGANVPYSGESIDHVKCPYCGADVLFDDDAAKTDRTLKAQSHAKRRDYESRIDYERQMQDLKTREAERQEQAAEKAAFRKGKQRKWLIALALITLIAAVVSFANGAVLSGIVALLQTVAFAVAYACGMQYIRPRFPAMRSLCLVLGLVLIIPFFAAAGVSAEHRPNLRWPESGLAAMLPDPGAKKGEVVTNDSERCYIHLYRYPEEKYAAFVNRCKDLGFLVDAEEDSRSYEAYDEAGYHLEITRYASDGDTNVSLDAPVALARFTWPTSGIATKIPAPKSTLGKFSYEDATSFYLTVGETTRDDYDAYVGECAAAGFTVDYIKGDDYYYADDAEGNHLSLQYEGNQIMTIYMDAPMETPKPKPMPTPLPATAAPEPTEAPTRQTPETPAPMPVPTEAPTNTGLVTPEFKAMMDSYEAFFDEYIEFMNKISSGNSTLAMLTEYAQFMERYTEAMDALDAIDETKLTPADDAYYLEVMLRINQKLLGALG